MYLVDTSTREKHSVTALQDLQQKVRLVFAGVIKMVLFIFRGQNSERPPTKRYDLYFGAKFPKSYDYSTRYDYSASGGTPRKYLCITRRHR